MFPNIARAILISSFSLALSACDENSTSGDRPSFSIGGPSTNTYFLGKSSPQNFPRASQEAQSCVWSRASNCGIKIDAASVYARSDFDLHSISKMQIEYWEAQGNILTAQRSAISLLRSLPGNSYATDFLRRYPPVPADIGLSRGTLIAIGAIVLAATQVAPSAIVSGAAPRETRDEGASGGYRIDETIQYRTGQDVVARGRCNNGRSFNVKYYPNNGGGTRDHAIGSLFGSSVEDVAGKYCI